MSNPSSHSRLLDVIFTRIRRSPDPAGGNGFAAASPGFPVDVSPSCTVELPVSATVHGITKSSYFKRIFWLLNPFDAYFLNLLLYWLWLWIILVFIFGIHIFSPLSADYKVHGNHDGESAARIARKLLSTDEFEFVKSPAVVYDRLAKPLHSIPEEIIQKMVLRFNTEALFPTSSENKISILPSVLNILENLKLTAIERTQTSWNKEDFFSSWCDKEYGSLYLSKQDVPLDLNEDLPIQICAKNWRDGKPGLFPWLQHNVWPRITDYFVPLVLFDSCQLDLSCPLLPPNGTEVVLLLKRMLHKVASTELPWIDLYCRYPYLMQHLSPILPYATCDNFTTEALRFRTVKTSVAWPKSMACALPCDLSTYLCRMNQNGAPESMWVSQPNACRRRQWFSHEGGICTGVLQRNYTGSTVISLSLMCKHNFRGIYTTEQSKKVKVIMDKLMEQTMLHLKVVEDDLLPTFPPSLLPSPTKKPVVLKPFLDMVSSGGRSSPVSELALNYVREQEALHQAMISLFTLAEENDIHLAEAILTNRKAIEITLKELIAVRQDIEEELQTLILWDRFQLVFSDLINGRVPWQLMEEDTWISELSANTLKQAYMRQHAKLFVRQLKIVKTVGNVFTTGIAYTCIIDMDIIIPIPDMFFEHCWNTITTPLYDLQEQQWTKSELKVDINYICLRSLEPTWIQAEECSSADTTSCRSIKIITTSCLRNNECPVQITPVKDIVFIQRRLYNGTYLILLKEGACGLEPGVSYLVNSTSRFTCGEIHLLPVPKQEEVYLSLSQHVPQIQHRDIKPLYSLLAVLQDTPLLLNNLTEAAVLETVNLKRLTSLTAEQLRRVERLIQDTSVLPGIFNPLANGLLSLTTAAGILVTGVTSKAGSFLRGLFSVGTPILFIIIIVCLIILFRK